MEGRSFYTKIREKGEAMKKEEFVALGISEELAAKAEAASLKELEGYVTKEQLDTANTEKKQLQEDIKARDDQLEELKKTGGDNAELKKQIEKLQEANKTEAKKHADELKELRLTSAIKLAIAGKVHDEDMAAALFDRSKLILAEDGKVSGLNEQLESIRKEKAFLFTDGEGQGPGTKGKPGYKPKGGEAHNESYAAQYAQQRNEAEKNGPKNSLWGAE